jgi:DNA-binding transcriptional LysR family regulator
LRLADVLEHEFVAPLPDAAGHTPEGWPVDLPRRIGLHVDQMRIGADVCASGELLAVLPDVIARTAGGSLLRRLPVDIVPATPLFVCRRSAPEAAPRVDAVVEAVRAEILRRGQRGAGAREHRR